MRRGSQWARSILYEVERKPIQGAPVLTAKEREARQQKRMEAKANHQKERSASWHRCHWCGEGYGTGFWLRTREHLIPKSKGGRDTFDNLVWAHLKCNSMRGSNENWIAYSVHQQKGKVMWR